MSLQKQVVPNITSKHRGNTTT